MLQRPIEVSNGTCASNGVRRSSKTLRRTASFASIGWLGAVSFCVLLLGGGISSPRAEDAAGNDYPTETRADYVFGCMAANGQTREALHRCSCSLDVIASILPYERYVEAETVLSMRQGVGQTATLFRSTKQFNDIVADLRRTQAEAEIRCFK